MKLELVKNAVTSKALRQVLIMKKNSPALMFGAGVVGVVGTTVLACKATLRLEEVLEQSAVDVKKAELFEHATYSEKDRAHDIRIIRMRTLVRVGKLYAPTVGLGVLSISALTGSHLSLTRRNAALTAAYAALDRGFNEYRKRVANEYGVEAEEKIRYDVRDKDVELVNEKTGKSSTVQVKAPHGTSIYGRVFDESNAKWQRESMYNQFFLQCQQNYANDRLRANGHIFLNEIYDCLGFERTKAGAIVGWVKGNGDNYIDFGIFDRTDKYQSARFVNGDERSVLLDFNVDGVIYDLI